MRGTGVLARPTLGATFAAPGSNAYLFLDNPGCRPVRVQWKRQGNKPAKLSRASIGSTGASACG